MDIEKILFMYILSLKEEKVKEYSAEESDPHLAYVFTNPEEYKTYFDNNGLENADDELLRLCRIKTTKKGNIIALKGLCDHAITRYKKYNNSEDIIKIKKYVGD